MYCICIYIYIYIYSLNTSAQAWCDTRSIFMWCLAVLTGWHTNVKEPSLSNYLPIAGGRIDELILFLRLFGLWEMQRDSFMIWTQITMSISYDSDHYTMSTSYICNIIQKLKACELQLIVSHFYNHQAIVQSEVLQEGEK